MRRDEAFVARTLGEFLGGPSSAIASDGDDPPDLYLALGQFRVGVEVTRLSQFTLEPDGTLGNRATQDFFGLRLLDELNTTIGPLLLDDISLLVGLWVPVSNAARFRKELKEWVHEIAMAAANRTQLERDIDGSRTSVSVIRQRPSRKKIVGFVVNKNSSADIGLNARLVLEDRIRTKSDICAQLPKPIWLAVLDDYWIADADSYAEVYGQLRLTHCFERIFLVADNGAVSELTIGA